MVYSAFCSYYLVVFLTVRVSVLAHVLAVKEGVARLALEAPHMKLKKS
jgi:hypothetical protein